MSYELKRLQYNPDGEGKDLHGRLLIQGCFAIIKTTNYYHISVYSDGITIDHGSFRCATNDYGNWTQTLTLNDVYLSIEPIKLIGSNIYTACCNQTGGTNQLQYAVSSDEGDNWTTYTASGVEDAYNIKTFLIIDFFKISTTIYFLVRMYDTVTPNYDLVIYDDSFTEVGRLTRALGDGICPGFVDTDNYYYFITSVDASPDTIIYKFNDTGNPVISETISTTIKYVWATYNLIQFFSKKGEGYIYVGNSSIKTNAILIKLNDSTDWIEFKHTAGTVGAASNVSWTDDGSYEPEYIAVQTYNAENIWTFYYITERLSFVKFDQYTLTNDDNLPLNGWKSRMIGGTIEASTFDLKTCDIIIDNKKNNPAHYLDAERCEFVYKGTDLVKNEGVLLYENDGTTLIHLGTISNISNLGVSYQKVTSVSPSDRDMTKKIEIDTDAKTYKEILVEDLALTTFLYTDGTGIDDPAGDIDLGTFKGTRKALYALLDRIKQKRIYWNEFGIVKADDGDTSSSITVANNECRITEMNALGSSFNGIQIQGGRKSDGSLAKVLVYELEEDNQDLNLVKFIEPLMNDDAASGQMEGHADNLFTQLKSVDFIDYKILIKNKGKVPLSKTVDITSTTHSLTNVNILTEEILYKPLNKMIEIRGKNGLFVKSNYKSNLGESTLQIAEQISEAGGNVMSDLVDDTTPQFGGDVDMNGHSFSSNIPMGTNKITGMGDPTANQDAVTKASMVAYVAAQIAYYNYACAFRGYRSSNQSIPNNTETIVVYNAEEYDIGNNFNTTTGLFTAPVDGIYIFDANVIYDNVSWAAGEIGYMYFKKNGSTAVAIPFRHVQPYTRSHPLLMHITCQLELVATDTIEVIAFHNTGAGLNVGGNNYYDWFSGFITKRL